MDEGEGSDILDSLDDEAGDVGDIAEGEVALMMITDEEKADCVEMD